LGEILVKEVSSSAVLQIQLLDALQRDGWPAALANPLKNKSRRQRARRLYEGVRGLNACQRNRLLRFGVENGEQLTWAFT
jgi:hypothetical protein